MKKSCYSLLFLVLLFSCSKDTEELNAPPQVSFTYTDKIETFSLVSTSSDLDNDILDYEWTTDSDIIELSSTSGPKSSFGIPRLGSSVKVTVTHTVCDGLACDSISEVITLPVMTYQRKWGLGCELEKQHSNNVSYEWYIDQKNTGQFNSVNCGPSSVTMAINWADESVDKTAEEARERYRSSGGWWYTSDIISYLNDNQVSNYVLTIDQFNNLTEELDKGNVIIICLDMYYINESDKDYWRVGRFYSVNNTGWGHFLVLKGYKVVDNHLFFEIYDPYSFGAKYEDNNLKGKDVFYRSEELDDATNKWWDYAIVVSRENMKNTQGVDVSKIPHMYGY